MAPIASINEDTVKLTLSERVKREQESYESGLQRQSYDNILSHCQVFWHDEVLRQFRQALTQEGVRDVLELGSHGWAMVYDEATPLPANLNCINISETELELGRSQADARQAAIDFHIMDAHELAFPNNSFDVVFGFGILHHLDYERALDEIKRVLRPGGRMIFNEPLDINPVGAIVRMATPNARTRDEAPLKIKHLKMFSDRFQVCYRPHQFLSVPAGVISKLAFKKPANALMRTAFEADRILARMPGLKFWFRKLVIDGVK